MRNRNIVIKDNTEKYGSAFREGSDEEFTIDIIELLTRLLDNAKHIITISLLCALIAGVIVFIFVTPVYTATSKLYIMSSDDSAINLSDLQMGTYLASDYQEVFYNWHVHERVIQKLSLPYDYETISDMLEVTNPSDTRILYISITSENPKEAKLIADTYADVAQEFITATMETREPSIFEEALLPTIPSAPHKLRIIVIAFAFGFIASCGFITVKFILDDRIRTASDIEKYLDLTVIGMMPLQTHQYTANSRKARKEGSR